MNNLPDPKTAVKVVSTNYTILTEGPLANRPCFHIHLGKKGKKTKIKKLCKKILSQSAVRFVVVTGEGSMNTDLATSIVRLGLYAQIETDGKECPETFPFLPNSIFVVVDVNSKIIHKEFTVKAMAFRYTINEKTIIGKDGLPNKLYRPADTQRTILRPEFSNDKKIYKKNIRRVVIISKHFGYYLSLPYNTLVKI